MLVLSRQRDEKIIMDFSQMTTEQFQEFKATGGLIPIAIVDIRGDKVRTGITAPRSVAVHREEVYNTIHPKQPIRT